MMKKVILSFVNNWGTTGGVDEFVAWSGSAQKHQDFYTDATCKSLYKAYVKAIIQRVNSINGRRYRDDPTIMAWNLVNEPRCLQCSNQIQIWINEMAPYVKSLDPNHLVSVGSEGFYASTNPNRAYLANPQGTSTWAATEGQDFVADNTSPSLDFATFHLWPDNWKDTSPQFIESWLSAHDRDAAALGKPVILEEFGKWVKAGTSADQAQRVAVYQAVYQQILQSASSGGAIKGSAFWSFLDQGQVAPLAEGGGSGLYGIRLSDPGFSLIRQNAVDMKRLASSVPQCSLRSSLPAVNGCQSSRIRGLPGTGYEGPSCNIDINECVRQTDDCSPNSACINTNGGFKCQCYWGYSGNSCTTPGPELGRLSAAYETDGPARVACDEGQNVVYPETAPGFLYDPTGSINKNPALAGGYGSLAPVSVSQCQIACETAQPACTAFSYNSVLQQCFLKSGARRSTCQSQEQTCESSNQDLVPQYFPCGTWQTYFRVGSPKPVTSSPSSGGTDTITNGDNNAPPRPSSNSNARPSIFDRSSDTPTSELVSALSGALNSGG
eukprot:jgi/Botrbrau1/18460/Bobra.0072s0043.1